MQKVVRTDPALAEFDIGKSQGHLQLRGSQAFGWLFPVVLLRFYVRGAVNTAVAYGEVAMAGAYQWVETTTGPILSVVQSVAVTEDAAEAEETEHGLPVTRIEETAATFRWNEEATRFEQQGTTLWRPVIPGL